MDNSLFQHPASLTALFHRFNLYKMIGNVQASRRLYPVILATQGNVSSLVCIALAVEAIEMANPLIRREDEIRSELLPLLQQDLTAMCSNSLSLRLYQRTRFCDLLELNKSLLEQITYGFTPRLRLGRRKEFIDTLISAGERNLSKGDEKNAMNEDENKVLLIALSYKHVYPRESGEGTISKRTAEEAYEVISKLPLVNSNSIVRIWIDQNLHRYSDVIRGEWYERGFIPYLLLPVVSVLTEHRGFEAGLTRPWIWVETGAAMYSGGIHCNPAITETLRTLVHFPSDTQIPMDLHVGHIRGWKTSLLDSVKSVLRSVSLWTIDVLNHSEYNREYIPSFIKFSMWARAQLMRINAKGRLDLNSEELSDGILEKMAWINSLPDYPKGRISEPYLRIELKKSACMNMFELLSSAIECHKRDNIFEVIGKKSGTVFCFQESEDLVHFNVNPSKSLSMSSRLVDGLQRQYSIQVVNKIQQVQGAYSISNVRNCKGKPNYFFGVVGKLFDKPYSFLCRKESINDEIRLSGYLCKNVGYIQRGFRFERVYQVMTGPSECEIITTLSESDITYLSELSPGLQTEIILGLYPKQAIPSIKRIVRMQADLEINDDDLSGSHLVGANSEFIMEIIGKNRKLKLLSHENEVNITRVRVDATTYWMYSLSRKYGLIGYVFRVRPTEPNVEEDLIAFDTEGDIIRSFEKISYQMGNIQPDISKPL